ncbi:hypothetical protein [Mycobacterium sp. ZZG]
MTSGAVHYRASGGVDFTFRFTWMPAENTWRIYIERQPSYGSRATGAHSTHRLGLPNRPYICWTDRLTSYEAARKVAAMWADATQRYIATGQFPPPSRTDHVRDQSTHSRHTEQQLRTALSEGAQTARTARPAQHPTSGTNRPGMFRRLLERIG